MFPRLSLLAGLWLPLLVLLLLVLVGCGSATPPEAPPPSGTSCEDGVNPFTPCVEDPAASPDSSPADSAPAVGDVAAGALIFGLTVTAQLPATLESEPFHLQPGAPLPTGAQVFFTLEASAAAHLYAFQVASGGAVSALFPSAPLKVANPLSQGRAVRLPPGDGAFKLNDQDMGGTNLYFVVSPRPLAELADALGALADGKLAAIADSPALRKVAAVVPAGEADGCQPLDLAAPLGEGCRRPVGENLGASLTGGAAPGGVEGGSLLLRAPASQTAIIAVFPFDHLSLAQYESLPAEARSRGIIMED